MTHHDLELTGLEVVHVLRILGNLQVGIILTLRIQRDEEHFILVPVRCCLETEEGVSFFKNGGILPTLLRRVSLESKAL